MNPLGLAQVQPHAVAGDAAERHGPAYLDRLGQHAPAPDRLVRDMATVGEFHGPVADRGVDLPGGDRVLDRVREESRVHGLPGPVDDLGVTHPVRVVLVDPQAGILPGEDAQVAGPGMGVVEAQP